VDIDVRRTGDGHEALEAAAGQADTDGWAFMVRTPSGGLHLYFPADPARPQSSWVCAAAHVDFRGAGGYIIAPPSAITLVDGERVGYRLIETGHGPGPVDAARLRDALDPQAAARRLAARVHRPIPSASDPQARAVGLVRFVATRGEGERNHALFWAFCRLAETGWEPDRAWAALAPAALQAGLLDREITGVIRSAYRHTDPTPAAAVGPLSGRPVVAGCEAVGL
jgi:hypothetical protein